MRLIHSRDTLPPLGRLVLVDWGSERVSPGILDFRDDDKENIDADIRDLRWFKVDENMEKTGEYYEDKHRTYRWHELT